MSEGTWRGGFDIREEGETNDANKNCGDIDLYFGCWYSDFDWLYQEEMKKLQSDKIISNLNVAFFYAKPKTRKYTSKTKWKKIQFA